MVAVVFVAGKDRLEEEGVGLTVEELTALLLLLLLIPLRWCRVAYRGLCC